MPIKLFGPAYTQLRTGEQNQINNPIIRSPYSIGRSTFTLSPPIMTNLALWIDMSDQTSMTFGSGINVTAISDKSLNNRGFTGAATFQAGTLNGYSVLQFVAGTHSMVNANCNLSGTTLTMFSVNRMYDVGALGRCIQGVSNNWIFGYWGGNHCAMFFNSFVVSEANRDTNWHMHSGWITAAGAAHVWEDTTDKGNTTGQTGPNNLGINAGGYGGERTDCQLGEILIYATQMSDPDRVSIQNYLKTKWGI